MKLTLTDEQIARFWAKVDIRSPVECWPWRGWRNKEGYGRFDLGSLKPLATHIALTLDGRPRPDAPADKALHGDTCGSPACTNPHHLRWGTGKENADDRDRLGRRTAARGEMHGCAKLKPEQVTYIRQSPLSQRKLAAELGVTQVMISRIRTRKAWAHLP